jgi:hypothetical protein
MITRRTLLIKFSKFLTSIPLAGLLFSPRSSRSDLDASSGPAIPLQYYNDTIIIDQRRRHRSPPAGSCSEFVIGMDEKAFQHICSSDIIYGPPGKIRFDEKNFGVVGIKSKC